MISRSAFKNRQGLSLDFETEGEGQPVIWQHGLGATLAQPAAVFPHSANLMRISLACRGHEKSDLGPRAQLTFADFAADVIDLMDHLDVGQAAIGGISLGAGVALNLAFNYAPRVAKLIFARPAWVDQPSLETQQPYLLVAELIKNHGPEAGLAVLKNHPTYQALAATSPDNAKSILGYFTRPRPDTTVALLSSISASYPGLSREQIAKIAAPALVIGNGEDEVHPLVYAKTLASLIPNAKLQVITSKTVSAAAYEAEFKQALEMFLDV